MSLLSEKKSHLIADKDIVCYKVLVKEKDYKFKTMPLGAIVDFKCVLGLEPFQPTQKTCELKKRKDIPGYKKCFEVSGGAIHSCTSMEVINRCLSEIKPNSNISIFSCIIPKGSWYYKDITGESYASEKLRFIRAIF